MKTYIVIEAIKFNEEEPLSVGVEIANSYDEAYELLCAWIRDRTDSFVAIDTDEYDKIVSGFVKDVLATKNSYGEYHYEGGCGNEVVWKIIEKEIQQ